MIGRRLFVVAMIAASFTLAGCAAGRSVIKVETPLALSASMPATNGKTVVIRNVTDNRVFEEKPQSPATPSLDSGAKGGGGGDVKARAFGRKRGGYGNALGDVVLDPGQTVAGVVKDNLIAAFRQAGYRVAATEAEGGAGAIVVDARIKQLWEYVTPAFAVVKVTINVETDLVVAGSAAPVNIKLERSDRGAAVTDNGFKTNLEGAMVEYRKQLTEQLNKPPF